METIKDYVEQIIRLTGVSGNAVPIVRHVLLVLVTILLAWAAGALCRKILIPVVHRITSKTKSNWDDILFNDNVLKTASLPSWFRGSYPWCSSNMPGCIPP